MERNISSLIKKTSIDHARNQAELKAARDTQRDLKAKLDALCMKEALLAGLGEVKVCRGIHSASEVGSSAGYAEVTRRKLQTIAEQAARIAQDRERVDRNLQEIQCKVDATSRLLDHLSKMK